MKWHIILVIISTLLTTGTLGVQASELPERAAEEKPPLSSVENIFVRKIRLEGNTLFSAETLSAIIGPYENREVTAQALEELREKLTRYHIDNGYISSGAILPDQAVENGEITFRIIEGRLTGAEISGNQRLRTHYIRSRLRLDRDIGQSPLNIFTLRERLRLLRQDAHIRSISAELRPGLQQGEADLKVEIKEARPWQATFRFNNHNAPTIGPYRGEIGIRHNNLSGWGDTLAAGYALTEGLDEYFFTWAVPLNRRDTVLSIGFDRSETVVVTAPFEDLDIRSDTTTCTVSLRHPFYKTPSGELAAGISFENRQSESELLGEGFAFSEGAEPDGESEISVWRLSQEWIDRSYDQVIVARSAFGFGVDMLGATVRDSEPDGQFLTWLGQFHWIRRLKLLESKFLFRSALRLSDDPLPAMEKFAIGGSDTVRGYRENQITTDNGLIASAEWRVPVYQLRIPAISRNPEDGRIQICPFFDFGMGWNTESADPDPDNISSLGLGLRWDISDKFRAEIYWGHGLRDYDNSDEHDLQDDGIHFQIFAQVF
ncbi:ShlB/FhaC/HecB family hemolysin secretion/activa tion protein [Desulfonema ishimotonii]|uniref:ShlB/FhaC/HecB family hemolysin secretion/activa tion protein n=1 Tax=Desulfonema ishimotonii TaxID=45657 RepID=A0A401G402_9BACT|nr:ShlB/FhaC/HecB family hemolysin secretion/activation protein [Desulfonema ishimotonii]GBC63845.1 ShlB/FhaC/HecB family hemolysin secretion/activa tion protein [Desulfonema ishimotonii]